VHRAMSEGQRTISYLLSASLLALTLALILEGAFGLNLILGWLISINFFTLLYYGIDKLNAPWSDASPANKAKNVRVPEWALLLLALVGGSPAAALAIMFLPHKTQEFYFIIRFLLILAIQGIALFFLQDQISALLALSRV
jgi:uncharacterized membrane protein YsdA (DUF1294 family)